MSDPYFVPKVNTAHQAKLEELKTEISEVDRKSSENCVVSSSIPCHLHDKVMDRKNPAKGRDTLGPI